MALSLMKKVVNSEAEIPKKIELPKKAIDQIVEPNEFIKVNAIIASPLKAMSNSIDLIDTRKINATTGKPINPNVDSVTGKYSADRIVNIVKAAKRYNLDPYELLAVDLQETGLGNSKREGSENVGHNRMQLSDLKVPTKLISEEESIDNPYDQFARAYATKMQHADTLGIKDPEKRIQVYNGLGKITSDTEKGYHGFKMKNIYGVPIPSEGIDMSKMPLYGKRILDLKENVLKKDPRLALYIEKIQP